MAEASGPASGLVWRLLRRLLPRGFRERRAEAVLDTHVALAGGSDAARGIRFWSRVAGDLIATTMQLVLDDLRTGSEPGRGGMSGVREGVVMAYRSLVRTPFFATAVILILALGISANVTVFRVLDRLLLSPPEHIESPEQVKRVHVLWRSPFTEEVEHTAALTYADYRELSGVSGFDALAGYSGRSLTLYAADAGQSVRVEMASASYFEMLGVRPAIGRFYATDEDLLDGAANVAVLGWSLWQQRFSGDAGVLGRELSIGKGTYTVIGVAPRGFTGVDLSPVDVWVPLHAGLLAENEGTEWVEARTWFLMAAVARVTGPPARAEEEASVVVRRVRADSRVADPDTRVVLSPLIAARGPNAPRESQVARILAVLTALVLLITCANVGNLYFARVLARRREFAVQAALGVTRRRLFGQLLWEVGMVALAAGVLAWWVGSVAAGGLFRILLPDAALPTSNGPRVLLLTGGLALLTTLLTGVLPAMRAMRIDVMDALRRGIITRRVTLVRRGLLTIQAALSVVLLIGAGLFIRSLQRAESVDLGLDLRALTVDIELEGGVGFGGELSDRVLGLLPVVRQSPLVESAAATSLAPFLGWWGLSVSSPEGESVESGSSGPYLYGVTGDYFSTIGLPIVRGRPLTEDDRLSGSPRVTVVNERLAAMLWPGRDAIGRCMLTERDDESPVCTTVVGVAANFLPSIGAAQAPGIFYVPPGHGAVGSAGANTMVVRPSDGVTPGMIAELVRSLAADARIVRVGTLADRNEPSFRAWQAGATLLSAVGILALIIAAAGLYSVLTFDVLQRRRELGIRAALGASSARLVRGAIAASFTAVGLGVAIGLVVSRLSGRALEAMLFRVTASDPLVYAGVCAVMLTVGLLAGALPTRAVTRTDPALPLREE